MAYVKTGGRMRVAGKTAALFVQMLFAAPLIEQFTLAGVISVIGIFAWNSVKILLRVR